MKHTTLITGLLFLLSVFTNSNMQVKSQPNLGNMILVKGGSFKMGDTFEEGREDERPVHMVTLDDFYIGQTEVTFEEYDAFCSATEKKKPIDWGWGRGKRPVIKVSWYDAIEYCNWLSEQNNLQKVYKINKVEKDVNNRNDYDTYKWQIDCTWSANGYRLPTEAEWEYAARSGGKKHRFGNDASKARADEINFSAGEMFKKPYSEIGEDRSKTVEVGSLPANSLGLYEMSGNVREWCWDWYAADYYEKNKNIQNPKGATFGENRVIRGGSWFSRPNNCRVTSRNKYTPNQGLIGIGFRLVRR